MTAVITLSLAGLIVSCNKPSLPTSYFFDGELAEFSGEYPDEWPEFLKLIDGTYIDNGGEIQVGPSGTMGFHGVVKGSHEEIIKHFRRLIAENGYYITEKSVDSVTHLIVRRSLHTKFLVFSIEEKSNSIDEDSVADPNEWVCYMSTVYSEDLHR